MNSFSSRSLPWTYRFQHFIFQNNPSNIQNSPYFCSTLYPELAEVPHWPGLRSTSNMIFVPRTPLTKHTVSHLAEDHSEIQHLSLSAAIHNISFRTCFYIYLRIVLFASRPAPLESFTEKMPVMQERDVWNKFCIRLDRGSIGSAVLCETIRQVP